MHNVPYSHLCYLSVLLGGLLSPGLGLYRPYMPGRQICGGCACTLVPESPSLRDTRSSDVDGGPVQTRYNHMTKNRHACEISQAILDNFPPGYFSPYTAPSTSEAL
jgi:hypothetical protein